jgi:heptosyltransferase-3
MANPGPEPAVMPTPDYRSILVVVTRRIGDVFLTGALLRSLRRAWPKARLDLLVLEGTEGVARTHADVMEIIAVPERASLAINLALIRRLWRNYDLALSTSPSDRPTLYAWAAGRRSVGVMDAGAKHFWKRLLLTQTVPYEPQSIHALVQNLRLADALGIARSHELPVSWSAADEARLRVLFPGYAETRYAVLHAYPKFRYKMWTEEGWRRLAERLSGQGLTVVLSGGPGAEEAAYVEAIFPTGKAGVLNLVGKLAFPGIAALIARAVIYVGPDTATTHLAAATGTPTVALFGPSNPVKWGPWPRVWVEEPSPYAMRGSQVRGNVALVQGDEICVPCLEEGCFRHVQSPSECLRAMTPEKVIGAIEALLREQASGTPQR